MKEPHPSEFDRLTPRQMAALRRKCGGQTNAEIGRALFVARSTVGNTLTEIMDRLGAAAESRRTAAVCYRLGRRDCEEEAAALAAAEAERTRS